MVPSFVIPTSLGPEGAVCVLKGVGWSRPGDCLFGDKVVVGVENMSATYCQTIDFRWVKGLEGVVSCMVGCGKLINRGFEEKMSVGVVRVWPDISRTSICWGQGWRNYRKRFSQKLLDNYMFGDKVPVGVVLEMARLLRFVETRTLSAL